MLINLLVYLLAAIRGWQIRPFLSQLVVVCCLRYILFSSYLDELIDPVLSWNLHICNMISRVRSGLASIIWFGSLPPAVLCVLYSAFVVPLSDYCDVIWTPSMAKQTCLNKKIHSKFMCKCSHLTIPKFPFTLTEHHQFHTAIQIFKIFASNFFSLLT